MQCLPNTINNLWNNLLEFLAKLLTMFVVTRFRYVLVCLFVLPLSFLFEMYMSLRNYIIFRYVGTAPSGTHEDRVKFIQEQIQKAPEGAQFCSARPSWQTMNISESLYKKTKYPIDLSNLCEILHVDVNKKTVVVEPFVTCGQLTSCLLPLGWTLPIVPELDDLTVGGLVAGTGIETSSHRYGLFQHQCLSFEVVLGDKSVVIASKDINPDLFEAIPWSYGTLGFITAIELRIIFSQEYVRLQYIPCETLKQCQQLLEKETKANRHDFLEAIVFGPQAAVVMLGDQIGSQQALLEPSKINEIGFFWKEWFYKHVESFLNPGNNNGNSCGSCSSRKVTSSDIGLSSSPNKEEKEPLIENISQPNVNVVNNSNRRKESSFTSATVGESNTTISFSGETIAEEYIPLRHYYHRHTKSIFWELEEIIPFGNHWIFRYLFGWLIPPKISFLKLTQTKELHELYKTHHVIQDMLIPLYLLEEALTTVFDKEWGIYPLWICPHLFPLSTKGFLKNNTTTEMFVDIGAYGVPKVKNFDIKESHLRVEKYVRDVKGFQMLYADTFMSKDQFREMFDHKLYDQLRKSLPQVSSRFPEVYDKVCITSRA